MNFRGIRVPRPYGMTQMMVTWHQTNDPKNLEILQSMAIQHWILNNGIIFGKHHSVQSLSSFIGCNPEMIRNHMMSQLVQTKIFNQENQKEVLEALVGQQLTWALEDRMDVEHQLSVLLESQKDKYTPFVTGEVNRVLGMKISTSTSLQNMIKGITGGTNNINIFNQQNNIQQTQGITIEEAVGIVQEESKKLMDAQQDVKYLETHYPINELPEVVASRQTNLDSRKEGLSLKAFDMKGIDNYTTDISEHETRRENELEIDPDGEDPEIIDY